MTLLDLIFLAIALPLGLVTAAVGRRVMAGPPYGVKYPGLRWFGSLMLLLVMLGLMAGLAVARQTIKGPSGAFQYLEGRPPPTT